MSIPALSKACHQGEKHAATMIDRWELLLAKSISAQLEQDGISANFGLDLNHSIEKLVHQEQMCCPFLSFTIDTTTDHIQLSVSSSDISIVRELHQILKLNRREGTS